GDNAVMSNYDADSDIWYGFAGAGEGMTSELAKTYSYSGSAYPHGMEVINTSEVLLIDNTRDYNVFPEESIDLRGIKSIAALPVEDGNRVVGVMFINFTRQYHEFTDEELALLRT